MRDQREVADVGVLTFNGRLERNAAQKLRDISHLRDQSAAALRTRWRRLGGRDGPFAGCAAGWAVVANEGQDDALGVAKVLVAAGGDIWLDEVASSRTARGAGRRAVAALLQSEELRAHARPDPQLWLECRPSVDDKAYDVYSAQMGLREHTRAAQQAAEAAAAGGGWATIQPHSGWTGEHAIMTGKVTTAVDGLRARLASCGELRGPPEERIYVRYSGVRACRRELRGGERGVEVVHEGGGDRYVRSPPGSWRAVQLTADEYPLLRASGEMTRYDEWDGERWVASLLRAPDSAIMHASGAAGGGMYAVRRYRGPRQPTAGRVAAVVQGEVIGAYGGRIVDVVDSEAGAQTAMAAHVAPTAAGGKPKRYLLVMQVKLQDEPRWAVVDGEDTPSLPELSAVNDPRGSHHPPSCVVGRTGKFKARRDITPLDWRVPLLRQAASELTFDYGWSPRVWQQVQEEARRLEVHQDDAGAPAVPPPEQLASAPCLQVASPAAQGDEQAAVLTAEGEEAGPEASDPWRDRSATAQSAWAVLADEAANGSMPTSMEERVAGSAAGEEAAMPAESSRRLGKRKHEQPTKELADEAITTSMLARVEEQADDAEARAERLRGTAREAQARAAARHLRAVAQAERRRTTGAPEAAEEAHACWHTMRAEAEADGRVAQTAEAEAAESSPLLRVERLAGEQACGQPSESTQWLDSAAHAAASAEEWEFDADAEIDMDQQLMHEGADEQEPPDEALRAKRPAGDDADRARRKAMRGTAAEEAARAAIASPRTGVRRRSSEEAPPSAERLLAAGALQARVAAMDDDERQAWAAGTGVEEVQAERARRAQLVRDGAAGARAAAGRIASAWGSRAGERRAAGGSGEGAGGGGRKRPREPAGGGTIL